MPTIEDVMVLQANMSENEFQNFMRYKMFCPLCPFKDACDEAEANTESSISCAQIAKTEIEKYKNKGTEETTPSEKTEPETTPPEKIEPEIHCYSFSQGAYAEIVKVTPEQKKLLDWMVEHDWIHEDATIAEVTDNIEDFTK